MQDASDIFHLATAAISPSIETNRMSLIRATFARTAVGSSSWRSHPRRRVLGSPNKLSDRVLLSSRRYPVSDILQEWLIKSLRIHRGRYRFGYYFSFFRPTICELRVCRTFTDIRCICANFFTVHTNVLVNPISLWNILRVLLVNYVRDERSIRLSVATNGEERYRFVSLPCSASRRRELVHSRRQSFILSRREHRE